MRKNKIIGDNLEIYYDKTYAIIKTLVDHRYYRISGDNYKKFLKMTNSEVQSFFEMYKKKQIKKSNSDSILFKKILVLRTSKLKYFKIYCPLIIMVLTIAFSLILGIYATYRLDLNHSNNIYQTILWLLINIFFHECGHALFTVNAGREVIDFGIKLNYGIPMFYVDTTDICMTPTNSRIKVSLAGVFMNAALALILYVLLCINIYTGKRLIVMSLLFVVSNLIPFMKLDGYYVFQDLLNISNLNLRSSQEVKLFLKKKKHYFFKRTKINVILLIYGLTKILFYATIFASVIIQFILFFTDKFIVGG